MPMNMITPALFLSNIVPNPRLGLPNRSLDFEVSSSQSLTIADSAIGGYNKSKLSISLWFKPESTAGTQALFYHSAAGASTGAFVIFRTSTGKLDIRVSNGTDAAHGRLTTTATYTSTSTWYHVLFHWDRSNATAGDRMRLWVSGTEVTAFDTDTNPTNAMNDSTEAAGIGGNGNGTSTYDGQMYQPCLFSNVLVNISQVYNAGSPKDVTGIAGLHCLLNTNDTDALEDDYVLSTNWTNNNTVIKSTTVPV